MVNGSDAIVRPDIVNSPVARTGLDLSIPLVLGQVWSCECPGYRACLDLSMPLGPEGLDVSMPLE